MDIYKEYKNRLTVLLRIAEKDNYAQLTEENNSNFLVYLERSYQQKENYFNLL